MLYRYLEKQLNIHVALCDSLNTPRAMALVKELIYQCNLYIEQEHSNTQLLAAIARYISRLMRIFGVIAEEIPIGYQLESAQPNLVCIDCMQRAVVSKGLMHNWPIRLGACMCSETVPKYKATVVQHVQL